MRSLKEMIYEPHGIYHLVSQDTVIIEYHCNKCNGINELQMNLSDKIPLREGCVAFPGDNQLYCSYCAAHHDVKDLRKDVEIEFHGSRKYATAL